MFEQTFSLVDLPLVAVLVFLECALSVDNALILGSLAVKLPSHLQKRSLWIGSLSALVFRGLIIIFSSFFMGNSIIQILGALYLAYLALRGLFFPNASASKTARSSFWKTVLKIELLDLIFAIDSILAAIAFTGAKCDKIWMVYLGGSIGLIAVRFMTAWLLKLFTKLPYLDKIAHVIIALVALKLGYHALQ